jgi:Na+-translocating ferredoxin:NAD+ oxidoreductase subunit B
MSNADSSDPAGLDGPRVTQAHRLLAQRINQLGNGFPAAPGGEELRLVATLYTEEDAELFIAMPDAFATAEAIADAAGIGTSEAVGRLASMAERGLIFRRREQGQVEYRPVPLIIGSAEFQLGRLTIPYLKRMGEYMRVGEYPKTFFGGKIPLLRSVPVNRQLVVNDEVLPVDDAVAIVRSKQRISVSDCYCRKTKAMAGDVCTHPLETCLSFDAWADFYVENGMGRYIGLDEALEILRRDEEEGLVIEVANSQDVEMMCACCSCHCGPLAGLRYHPGPATQVYSNYKAEWDGELCVDCLQCVPRCPVGARTEAEGRLVFDRERCIGCGLCVSVCAGGASTLRRKEDAACYDPPQDLFAAYAELQKARAEV